MSPLGGLIAVAVAAVRGTYRWLTGYRDPYRRNLHGWTEHEREHD